MEFLGFFPLLHIEPFTSLEPLPHHSLSGLPIIVPRPVPVMRSTYDIEAAGMALVAYFKFGDYFVRIFQK